MDRERIYGTLEFYTYVNNSTPDCRHEEQTAFIIFCDTSDSMLKKVFQIEERFFAFEDCHNKTGKVIAMFICKILGKSNILLS